MRLLLVLAPFALVAIVAVAVRDGAAPESATRSVPGEPLLAVAGDRLVRVDPLSLRPLGGGGLRLRDPVEGWARGPDGSRVVVVTGRGSTLRFLDAERMRPLGRVDARTRGQVAAVAWPRRDRLLVALAVPGCCATGRTTVVTVDPVRRRVVARHRLPAGLVRAAETPDGLVLLLAPSSTIGPSMIATVDAAGRADRVPLDGVSAGLLPTEGVPFILRTRRPGLAVDPRRGRIYVLPGRPDVVEVDLRRRRVTHHRLATGPSLLERLRDLLEPRAEAQPAAGPVRTATWLAPGVIAVAGRDWHVSWRADGGLEQGSRAAGLQVIETRRWQTRTLDEEASGFRAAHGLLLTVHAGLTAYRADGREAFQLLGNRPVELVATAGSLAYVRVDAGTLHVVDLAAGRIIATVPRPPRLLTRAGPWD